MLQAEERIQLGDIIAGLNDFTDGGPRGRRVLIQQATLGRFLPMDLFGDPETVAGDLIGRIEDYGYLSELPTKHALGALLSYVLTRKDLRSEDARFMARLIVRYSLVTDPLYLEKLRTDYNISDEVVRPPLPEHLGPSATTAIAPAPDFTVMLKDEIDQRGLEAIINSEDNFLDIYILFGAIYSAQAVCRIEVPTGTAKGTGFLIGPDLLLTNQHVLPSADYLGKAVARFDYRMDETGAARSAGRVYELEPDFYFSSPAEALDYAVVRTKDQPLKHMAAKQEDRTLPVFDLVLRGKHRGYLVLHGEKILKGSRVNIVQHPNGHFMKVVMTQNYVVGVTNESRVQYVADTMEGSSGAPVFNEKWEVVALHHSGKPYPPDSLGDVLKKAWKSRFRVNEGISMQAILKNFEAEDNIRQLLPRE